METNRLLSLFADCAADVSAALSTVHDLRAPGERPTQYALDLAADAPVVERLRAAGLGVMSEESGRQGEGAEITVVVDPVDGSTNASRGIPWFATSLAAVDSEGVLATLVRNLATGVTYTAVRGGGAFRDGVPIAVSTTTAVNEALVAMNGHAPVYFGWGQYRALGAAALDLCLVAEGAIDGYLDCTLSSHGPWDYLGALLVITEAGGSVTDAEGRNLVTLEHSERRTPVAAGSAALHETLLAARRSIEVL